MALTIVATADERLVSDACVSALERALGTYGQVTLLVETLDEVTEAERELAGHASLTLGVRVHTPASWVRQCWEVWGDGRVVADGPTLTALAHEVLREATPQELGPIELNPGTVKVVARLASGAVPWIPHDGEGGADEDVLKEAGLTAGEVALCRLAVKLDRRLETLALVSSARVAQEMPRRLASARATVSPCVLARFRSMPRSSREFVEGMSELTDVTLVANVVEGPAADGALGLAKLLGGDPGQLLRGVEFGARSARSEELDALISRLFAEGVTDTCGLGCVEVLQAAGPLAEAELVARKLTELADEGESVVVAVPDVERAWRELVPKLEERDVTVRVSWSSSMAENSHAVGFLGYCAAIARLSELAESWPQPREGIEGEVPQLGDMDWWPPRELADFLFEDMAHMEPERVWKLDALWRGNRLLTPALVLEMLQKERLVSTPVARATFEILRGRIGSAAARLIAPYGNPGAGRLDTAGEEACTVLRAVQKLAGILHSLGVSCEAGRSLGEVVALLGWAMEGTGVKARLGAGPDASHGNVTMLGYEEASRLAPASADVVVACGLTSQESPVEGREGVLEAILARLGIEPETDGLGVARARFRALAGVARKRLVCEYALTDSEGKVTYPAVMLQELFGAMGTTQARLGQDLVTPPARMSERALKENLSRRGVGTEAKGVCEPAAAGRLEPDVRSLVFVPQAGSEYVPDELPYLSASQIEAFLDCPYKWFSQRRLALKNQDATYGAAEMGTFAHRVLEVTHRELLARALRRSEGDAADVDELMRALESDPCRHIPGTSVSHDNLEEAREVLEHEFDLHLEHQMREKSPRPHQQLLVPHSSYERGQEANLRKDLMSVLEYQTKILQGFEPRFFEWSFGRHDEPVVYAGARFIGTVDRIDVSPHGTAVIIDYKHKSAQGFANEYDASADAVVGEGVLPRRVQSLIYAQIVRRAFKDSLKVVGSVYLSTRAPHALAGVVDENVLDNVFGTTLSAKREPRVGVSRAQVGSSGMDEMLDATEELIAQTVREMRSGDVSARPRDAHSCDYCPVTQCERRVAR